MFAVEIRILAVQLINGALAFDPAIAGDTGEAAFHDPAACRFGDNFDGMTQFFQLVA